MMNGKVPFFFFSSECLGYFTIGRPADNVMTTQEDTTGLLQKTSVWTMSRPGVKKVMNSYFIAAGHGPAVCYYAVSWLRQGFSITLTSFGRIPWPQAGVGTCPSPQSWVSPFLQPHREHHYAKTSSRSQPSLQSLALCLAYSRCPVNICQMTECISPASGCHQALREPERSEESFWIPATPHISSIFSES
ncbi:PREDICTED: LOW QUALITY PROTEIN: uncharacterized protein C22orf24 homolog [Cercocebus atys]|uniref:LOW QUALITY PROTEIN: uncharacterized protein C22orf24 homolog n=1 Tax=Cercocebus atys TaxID=9531 RepID=UPI0005F40D7A|nr:PREDICTED: LOW QUALITY PROTEIN: uncharacterized protein C22orf24 homolog [Cercocebus atys]